MKNYEKTERTQIIRNAKEKKNKQITNKTKTTKILIIIAIIILAIFVITKIFIPKTIKKSKIGNNSTSQEIVENFLNISSYEATIEMTVYSNKNENKYKIKQIYKKDNSNNNRTENNQEQINTQDYSCQEILEPSNIAGIKIIQEGNKLTLQNSKLNLTNIIENYKYITDSCIDLRSFIEEFTQNETSKQKEEGDKIILETKSNTSNPYIKNRILKLDRKTGNPIQMECKGENQKTTIYIVYNEVKINV